MVFNLLKKGFTLIELLVSTSIILLLIVSAAPSYSRVRSRNDLRLAAQNLQNCFSQARSLALGPRTGDEGIDPYDSQISQVSNQWRCQIRINFDSDKNGIIESSNAISDLPIILSSGLNLRQANNPNSLSNLSYRFDPDDLGKADPGIPLPNITNLYLNDSSNICLNLRFVYETGELLLEDLGNVSRQICQ